MKLQCACGAKYAFDVTPEMVQNPVRFVCPACGQDSSDFVNELVRRELGAPAAVTPPPLAPAPPPPPSPAATAAPRLRVSITEAVPPVEAAPVVSRFCARHTNVRTTEKCAVCHKPICPRCLEAFGYFCSPLCKNKADEQNIIAPVYAGQKFEVEARFWRKIRLVFGSVATALVLFFGVWVWWAWFATVPHTYFSVRFDDGARAHTGRSQLVGKDQIVFLHGGTLARYDMKTKKQIWSQQLVTPQQITDKVKSEDEETARDNAKYGGSYGRAILPRQHEKNVRDRLESALTLRVSGSNVWTGKVAERTNSTDFYTPADYQLTRYDWDSGRILQQVTIPEDTGEFIERDTELVLLKHTEVGAQFVTHVSLVDGTVNREEFYDPGATKAIASTSTGSGTGGGKPTGGGLLSANGGPLDPNLVAQQAQNLKLPARVALPALLANASHEQQLEAALRDTDPQRPKSAGQKEQHIAERFTLIPSTHGYIQFGFHLIEAKSISHVAMKAPPKKSVLNDANLNASQTADVANEMLNERQRANGGDVVTEDVSTYQVSIRRTDSPDVVDWTGEVTGPPNIFPLKTVNVLTAGKTVIVFDKTNKKLWEATLTYSVLGGDKEFYQEAAPFGEGPCAEHGDALYVFDQAVLSAFDLTTGNARWHLPSVGIVGLFFDDQGMVYVNTTSSSLDDIRYSRQIDITKSVDDILIKVEPKTGKTLWRVKPGGFISYVSGKFIYTVESNDPNPTDEEELSDTMSGLQKPPYLRIARVSPKDGHILWDHEQDRCPVDVRFNENSIQLLFKKEVQVLRYLSF